MERLETRSLPGGLWADGRSRVPAHSAKKPLKNIKWLLGQGGPHGLEWTNKKEWKWFNQMDDGVYGHRPVIDGRESGLNSVT